MTRQTFTHSLYLHKKQFPNDKTKSTSIGNEAQHYSRDTTLEYAQIANKDFENVLVLTCSLQNLDYLE